MGPTPFFTFVNYLNLCVFCFVSSVRFGLESTQSLKLGDPEVREEGASQQSP